MDEVGPAARLRRVLGHPAFSSWGLALWFAPLSALAVLAASYGVDGNFNYSGFCGDSLWALGILVACGVLAAYVFWPVVTLVRAMGNGFRVSRRSFMASWRTADLRGLLVVYPAMVVWSYLIYGYGAFCGISGG